MRIGIDMRGVSAQKADGLAVLLQGVLRALFARHPEHRYVVFCTAFNRQLLDGHPDCVEVFSIPPADHIERINRLIADRKLDVLLRTPPLDDKFAFPPRRQIFLVADLLHEAVPERFDAATLRRRRLGFTQAVSAAGALAAPSWFVAQALRQHQDTQCQDIFVLSTQELHDACYRLSTSGQRPEILSGRWSIADSRRPLVSIVTPSYNQGCFLRRTIDSVLNQTYPHIEYLVIDGGSTDESTSILQSYGDRFRWVSEPDRGQTSAINKGFARSRGEIRAYLNSDDVLLPRAVERAVAHFRRNPDCDLVYGRANYIDKEDNVIGPYASADYSFARLVQDCCICQPAAFWSTRIARRAGPFDERLHYAMDFDYWLRIDRAGGRIEHLPKTLACSRLYAETKTLSARREIYREIFDICQRHAGYVHMNYFHGLWHHLCFEAESGLPRRLSVFPGFRSMMSYLHHKWWHREKYPLRRVVGGVVRRVRALAPLRRLYDTVVRPRSAPTLGADNYLAPTCRIVLRDATEGETLRLAGIPRADMRLTIELDGRFVSTYRLRGGHYEKIAFPFRAGAGQTLSLKFSHCDFDDFAHRYISFQVHDTNLFHEQDAA